MKTFDEKKTYVMFVDLTKQKEMDWYIRVGNKLDILEKMRASDLEDNTTGYLISLKRNFKDFVAYAVHKIRFVRRRKASKDKLTYS